MDRLLELSTEVEKKFLELTPQNSPKPQASSTFMLKYNEEDFDNSSSKKPESSTLSSLGVIDIDKESLLSEKEFDTWSPQQSTPYHQRLISEYQSQSMNQLKKRLDELSFRSSSFSESTHSAGPANNDTFNTSSNTIQDKIRNSLASSSQMVLSSQSNEFQSGNLAVLKLEEDQKENRKMYASLPVSPMNISENSESIDEKEQKFAEFVRLKCYPPEDISQILRNRISQCFNKEDFQPKIDDHRNTSVMSVNQGAKSTSVPCTSQPSQSDMFQRLLEASYSEAPSVNSTFDVSSSNSIASINEIAELLKRQSLLAMPKRAVEELLSLGKPKKKAVAEEANLFRASLPMPYVNLSESSSRETTLINASGISDTFASSGKPSQNILSSTVRDDIAPQNKTRHETPQKTLPLKNLNSLLSNYADPNKRIFSLKLPPHSVTEQATVMDELARDFVDLNVVRMENEENAQVDSTRQSMSAAAVQRISSNHSLLTGDSAPEGEDIFAGTLCVGTLAEVIVAVENPTTDALNYKINLKSITPEIPIEYPAASVMLASSEDRILFLPETETEINVMVTPLVEGKISITLEFVSEDKKCSNITRLIEVIGEMPKFKISEPQNGVAQFGILSENIEKTLPLILQNNGSSKLPLKLMLYEDDRNPICYKTLINPLETLKCGVSADTCHLKDVINETIHLQGKLIVLLDTPEGIPLKIPLIKTILLTGKVARDVIRIDNESPLVLKSNGVSHVVEYLNVKNNGLTPLDIYAETEKFSEFVIEPKYVKMSPQQRISFEVIFKPHSSDKSRDSNIYLNLRNINKKVPFKVIGIVEADFGPPSGISSPVKSRNQSYKSVASSGSSTGSSVGYDGIMELDSTHSSLSWASVPVHTRKIQTFTLRNRGPSKEKLLLTISDSFNFFKFIENESYVKELRLTLESKESRKISVSFTPAIADQSINGKITIVRRNTLESSLGEFQKRVIPLFGIGGSVKMMFSGIFHDNEDRLWINCESQSFETKFIVENGGDAEAFVRIVSEEPDDRVFPEECTLLPSESMEINYMLNLNTDRLDMLCKQSSHKEVMLVNKLIIYSGNESNRLRLKRMWSRNADLDKVQKIRDKMDILNFDSNSRLRIDSLLDNESVFTKFLYEGVTEHVIGVLVPRQNLENVSLDSTVIFKDLTNFTFEHVYHC